MWVEFLRQPLIGSLLPQLPEIEPIQICNFKTVSKITKIDRSHPMVHAAESPANPDTTMPTKLVGVVGGSIGVDPFNRKTWSGISHRLFSAIDKRGALHRAFGVQPGTFERYALMARNFRMQRNIWRKSYFMDCGYRVAATKSLSKSISSDDLDHPFLQIGGMFNAPEAVLAKTQCFSYQDGNLAQAMTSDAVLKAVSPLKLRAAMKYETDLYQSLDGIFTFSDYLRDSFISEFGVPASRVVNVRAGINLDEIPPVQQDKNYDSKHILFVGIEFKRKGGWNVLKAFKILHEKCEDSTLHIVGPRKLELPDKLSKGVQQHGYLDKGDPVQAKRLNTLLTQASLFVMPSLYEPFGVAPLEAMVNQIPAIVTNRWALKEIVQPGYNGALVEPDEVDDLYETMSRLLSRPDDLKRMGNNGREFVLSNYTWEHTVQRVITCVNNRIGASVLGSSAK